MLTLLAAALLGLLPLTDLGERLELRTQDLRFAQRGPRPTTAKIVLVTLDAGTAAAWREPMAFWGVHYSRLIRQAHRAGARCIGFDIIPALDADEALQSLVARAAERTVPPTTSGTDSARLDAVFDAPEMNPDRELTDAMRDTGNVVLADSRRSGMALAPEVRDQIFSGEIGFVDPPVQEDDAVRTAPLRLDTGSRSHLSFPALVAARATSGFLPTRDRTQTTSVSGATLLSYGINYTQTTGLSRVFPRIPAWKVAAGQMDEKDKAALRDAVVLVGDVSPQGEDWHHIPGGLSTEGVAIQAQAVATLLDHQALRQLTRWQEALLTCSLLVLLTPCLVRLTPGWGGAVVLIASSAWWTCGVLLFAQAQWMLPQAAPLLGGGTLYLIYHAARAAEETSARRRIEQVFGHNVSPVIRDYLLAAPAHLALGGQEVEASVMFFDLRGMTGFSEARSPQAVVAELNALYREIVPLIERQGGLLFRFLGDGFLVVFGAPLPLLDHAGAACQASREIMQTLNVLNASRRRAGLNVWQAGCGIHTGWLVCGNLGVPGRAEFTVIGDTVNLAARLEGLTKQLSGRIVVSAETYFRAADRPPAAGPFERQVSGRQEPVCVYVLDE